MLSGGIPVRIMPVNRKVQVSRLAVVIFCDCGTYFKGVLQPWHVAQGGF
jgi:hypothetical protein